MKHRKSYKYFILPYEYLPPRYFIINSCNIKMDPNKRIVPIKYTYINVGINSNAKCVKEYLSINRKKT